MRRTRLRAGLLVVVALALAGIGYEVSRSIEARRARTVLDLGADFLPEVAQHIKNFKRVKVEQGRAVWEIVADEARFFEKDNDILVVQPRITLYLRDGREAHIRGAEGHVTLDGKELRKATMRGEVVVVLGDLEMRMAEATYSKPDDLITAPGTVTMHGRTLDVQGTGMEVAVTPQLVRLLRDVQTVVRNDASKS
jgi:LPS export ABC transporter protein LptC